MKSHLFAAISSHRVALLTFPPKETVPLASQLRKLGFFAIVCIVGLRLAVGWHFYKAGVEKFTNRNWTSAGVLGGAKGPLAAWFKNFAPLPDANSFQEQGVVENWGVFLDQATAAYGYESPGFLPTLEREVAQAEASVKAATSPEEKRRAEAALKAAKSQLAGFKKQVQAASEALSRRQSQLKQFLQNNREDIDEYLRELEGLQAMVNDSGTGTTPFHQQRIAAKEAELRGKAKSLLAGINQLNESFERDLYNLATPEQRARGVLRRSDSDTTWVDAAVKWTVLLVGVCLILGLFTRPAAVMGALFLSSVLAVSGWPFWAGDSDETLKVTVELLALLTLAAVGAGRFAGLDFFLYALWTKLFGSRHTVGEQA